MSMTREEAIKALRLEGGLEISGNARRLAEFMQGLDVAITALRGPTREMVERMRGKWVDIKGEKVVVDKYGCPVDWANCFVCGKYLVASEEYSCTGHFCPNCGAPMTDEAVDMMLRRWKEAADGET